MSDKLLILGSRGFIGKNVFNYFNENSNYKTIGLTRDNIDFSNSEELIKKVNEIMPSVVIHTAVSLDNFENNIKMYLALENIAKDVNKILLIGSGAEYIPSRYKPKMKEDYFPKNSVSIKDTYTLSKYTISRLHQNNNFKNIFNLRVFGIYGPFEDYKRRLISNNIVRNLNKLPLQYNRNVAFDYLYINDFNSAIDRFIKLSNPKHNTYNLCNGKAFKFKEIMNTIADVTGFPKHNILLNNSEPSPYEYSGDSSLIENEIGKVEQTTLYEAIYELNSWYSSQNISNFKLED